jgi:lysophospholipase L1-like esterase
MQWYEAEVRELIARLAAERVPEPAVFYGSSSIRLWTTLGHDLEAASAVNAGFGGSTLEACAFFFDRIVAPLKPASLIVYAGDNDLGDGRTADEVLEAFRRLAGRVDEICGPIPFAFMSIKPSPARAGLLDAMVRANALVRNEIEQRPNGFYIPIFESMLRGGQPRPELFADDGLHLAPAGYALWTQLLEPFKPQIFDGRLNGSTTRPGSNHTPLGCGLP